MKHFLIIQKSSPIVDYIELYLKTYKNIQWVHVESISASVAAIKQDPKLDCVFIGHALEVDGQVKDLVATIKEHISKTPTCKVIGSNKGLAEQDWVSYIPSIAPPVKFFEAVREALQLPAEATPAEYASVPIFCLKYFLVSPADVYFRLGKEGEYTFVKRFNEGDAIDAQELQKYAQKDLKQIFVPSNKLKEVSDAISAQIATQENFERKGNSFEPVVEALDYASYVLKNFGFKESNQQVLVKKVMENISFSLQKGDKGRTTKIENILNSKDTYFFKHVALTAMLSNMLIGELRWEFSDELQTAIVYASFFQNFFITNEDEIACLDEVTMNFFKEKEQREKVRDHAKLAFDFIREMKDVSYDAQKLVLEQHGSKFGIGYPEKKGNTNQLSSLFMIANEFAVHFLTAFESHPPRDIRPMLAQAKEVYGKSNSKIVEALDRCISRMALGVGLKKV